MVLISQHLCAEKPLFCLSSLLKSHSAYEAGCVTGEWLIPSSFIFLIVFGETSFSTCWYGWFKFEVGLLFSSLKSNICTLAAWCSAEGV